MIGLVIAASATPTIDLSPATKILVPIFAVVFTIKILNLLIPANRGRGRYRRRKSDGADPMAVVIAILLGLCIYAIGWGSLAIRVTMGGIALVAVGVFVAVLINRKKPMSRKHPPIVYETTSDKGVPLEDSVSDFSKVKTIAEQEGDKGEAMVREVVKHLPPDRYCVLHNVRLPLEYGPEAQIDHIVVSLFGIFVIETKNWKGVVYGDANSVKWTKFLHGAKMVLQNPLRQNIRHVAAVKGIFDCPVDDIVFGIVAINPEVKFMGPVPDGIVFYNELSSWIYKHVAVRIEPEQVSEIVNGIQSWATTVP